MLDTPHRTLSGVCFSHLLALSGAFFPCLLADVFGPSMVLHKTRQHGSICSFHSAKETSQCSFKLQKF